ncbi:hypothetical protein M422DRAFT_248285 [Sphaerobolus stellatus SS14]|uniref:Retrotransposon gag domain-containing protein n=1 Tax=Sphaerobolus stellatus (strain SS14) TaxID=990650 RepID=A0A0C9W513_SPHS4|nr:hypothetical protein M422DRAFT_248285 [Sphaerobolus stellatus SS14]
MKSGEVSEKFYTSCPQWVSDSSKKKRTEGDKQRRRHKEKRRKKSAKKLRKMLSHVKVNTPPTYSGAPNIEILDRWAYAVNGWTEIHALEDKWAVRLVANFLSGKASTFYMRHVAPNHSRWTLKELYLGLFDYCFPPDYKADLRDKLEGFQPRELSFIGFAREVENLASKFPDITKCQRTRILWKGAVKYLRLKWMDRGYSAENVKWSCLVKLGAKYEAVELQKRKERNDNLYYSRNNHNWSSYGTRNMEASSSKPVGSSQSPQSKAANNSGNTGGNLIVKTGQFGVGFANP